MITIHVSRLHGVKLEIDKFIPKIKRARLKVSVNGTGKATFSVPAVTQFKARRSFAAPVVQHDHQVTASELVLAKGCLTLQSSTKEVRDFARVFVGHPEYVLFLLRGMNPSSNYTEHRALVAMALGNGKGDLDQRQVLPVEYNLDEVQTRFPDGIWAYSFKRLGHIQKGIHQGNTMEQDPLFEEFPIAGFIGIKVQTPGRHESVKVLRRGRLQFMAWQADDLEDLEGARQVVPKILQAVESLKCCEF